MSSGQKGRRVGSSLVMWWRTSNGSETVRRGPVDWSGGALPSDWIFASNDTARLSLLFGTFSSLLSYYIFNIKLNIIIFIIIQSSLVLTGTARCSNLASMMDRILLVIYGQVLTTDWSEQYEAAVWSDLNDKVFYENIQKNVKKPNRQTFFVHARKQARTHTNTHKALWRPVWGFILPVEQAWQWTSHLGSGALLLWNVNQSRHSVGASYRMPGGLVMRALYIHP